MKPKVNLNYVQGKVLEDGESDLNLRVGSEKNNESNENVNDDESFRVKRETIDLYEKYYKDLPIGSRIERSVEACEFLADMCRFVWLRGGGVMTID